MYDMHYDLLTILYYKYKHNNSRMDIENFKIELAKLYRCGIKGGIVNLYFMSEQEMFEELGITKDEMSNIFEMFEQSLKYLNALKSCGVIDSEIDYLYGLEGCDLLKDENDLQRLYELGLRSIIPVWNTKNKFGSGNRTNSGLTDIGIKLIEKAIELNIIVDLSHANEKTFYDIIKVIEKHKEQNPFLIASHSNVRQLCDRDRNLTDEQLKTLKDMNGYIGLFTNGNFLSNDNLQLTSNERLLNFMKHLKYVIEKIGFDTKKIIVSTDDMNFHPDTSYHNLGVYPLNNIYFKLFEEIKNQYGFNIAKDILTNNAQELIAKVKQKEIVYGKN